MGHVVGFLLGYLIEGLAVWLYASAFSPKRSLYTRILLLSVSYLVLAIIGPLDLKGLNGFLYLSATFLFLFLCYRIKWFGALFHALILTAVMAMYELMVYSIMDRVAPHFYMQVESFYYSFLYIIFSKFPFLLTTFLFAVVARAVKTKEKSAKGAFFYMVVPFASVFTMVLFIAFLEKYELSEQMKRMICVSSVLLLVANVIMFVAYLYTQKKFEDYLEISLTLQREHLRSEYYDMLRKQDENQKILLHDIRKHLNTIEMLNAAKENEKIDAYIKEMYTYPEFKPSLVSSDNDLLNAVLAKYRRECENLGIRFGVDVRSHCIDFLSENEITTLFANLLDNARQAAEHTKDAFIDLYVYHKEDTPYLVLRLQNSCKENPFESDGKTLKKKKEEGLHGIGLKSIRRIIDKYDGNMEMHYDKEKKYFQTTLMMKQPKTDETQENQDKQNKKGV